MNPAKVVRSRVTRLTDLPNVGPSIADDLTRLGITSPSQLAGMDPYEMYDRMCDLTRVVQDPCVLDVFISITRFMDGEPPSGGTTRPGGSGGQAGRVPLGGRIQGATGNSGRWCAASGHNDAVSNMSGLSRGTRLGAYEILAELGRWGMGEVYRPVRPHQKRSDTRGPAIISRIFPTGARGACAMVAA